MDALPGDELARAALEGGDQDAFAELVSAHGSAVFAVAYSITGDRAASEDLAQEAFLAAWRGRGELRDPTHFRAWVCGIARNLGRNEIRRRARSEALAERYCSEQPATTPAPVALSIERETEALLWRALRDLPERHREVLTLYYREGRSAAQVASALGISEALVCKWLQRARAALRDEAHRRIEAGLAELAPPPDFRRRVLAALPLGSLPGLPPAGAAAPSGAAPLTLGAFIVSNTAKIAAAAACILALGLAWKGVAGGDDRAPAGPDAPATPVALSAGAPTASAATAAPRSGARRPDAPALPGAERQGDDHDDHRSLSLAIEGDDGTLWYKLMPALRCHDELSALGRDVAKEPLELGFSFAPGPGGARLRSVSLRGVDGQRQAAAAYERCVLAALADQVFPPGTTSAAAALTTAEHAPAPEPLAAPTESMFAGPSRGPADAPVRILVYTDFQCPFCSKALVTIDQLVEEFPEDIRIITKLYPLKPSSRRLAEATAAAGEQGKFWDMHDLIFAYQDQGAIDDALLASFAEQLGLDLARFRADLDSDTIASLVEADLAEGRALGIQGTPAFFVNEHQVVGAQPIEVFRELVVQELAELE